MVALTIDDIKARVDLRTIVERDLGKPKYHYHDYDQYLCPFHSEKTPSFTVWSDGWQCFGACAESGDAVWYLKKAHGLETFEAIKALKEIAGITDGLSKWRFEPKHLPPKARTIEIATPPSAAWQELGWMIVKRACEVLWSPEGSGALQYLREQRGLDDTTIRLMQLGYVPGDPIKNTYWRGLVIPHGITIPWRAGRPPQLWGIKVRRFAGERKYLSVFTQDQAKPHLGEAKQSKGLYLANNIVPGRPVVVLEGEFDGMVVDQEACDLVSAVTVGSASYGIDPCWYPSLALAPSIIACFDNDAAGNKAETRLGNLTARAQFVKVPAGKDVTDYWIANRANDPRCIHTWIKSIIASAAKE